MVGIIKKDISLGSLLGIDFSGKDILIIGIPGSGKSWVSDKLKGISGHRIFHTDSYMVHGFSMGMYACLDELRYLRGCNSLVEGVYGYRLLRKGVEDNCYYPDVVIEMIISSDKQSFIYNSERDVSKLKYLKGFAATNDKIIRDYMFAMEYRERKPLWYVCRNDY